MDAFTELMALDRDHCNVVTIEDPVEFTLEGVSHTQIRPAKG